MRRAVSQGLGGIASHMLSRGLVTEPTEALDRVVHMKAPIVAVEANDLLSQDS